MSRDDNLWYWLRHRDFQHFQHLRRSEQEAAIVKRAFSVNSLPEPASTVEETRSVRILTDTELEQKERSPVRKVIFVESEEEAGSSTARDKENLANKGQKCKRRRILPPTGSEISASGGSTLETPPQSPKFPETPPLSPGAQEPRQEEEEDLELVSPYENLEFVDCDSAEEEEDSEEDTEVSGRTEKVEYVSVTSGIWKKTITVNLFSSDEEEEEEVVTLD